VTGRRHDIEVWFVVSIDLIADYSNILNVADHVFTTVT